MALSLIRAKCELSELAMAFELHENCKRLRVQKSG
jgi:hypothetical protein